MEARLGRGNKWGRKSNFMEGRGLGARIGYWDRYMLSGDSETKAGAKIKIEKLHMMIIVT